MPTGVARTSLAGMAALFLVAVGPIGAGPRLPQPADGQIPDAVRAAVNSAIQKVYPALVRIHAVEVSYEQGREVKSEGAGSGVIFASDGYIITNHHVAGKAMRIL